MDSSAISPPAILLSSIIVSFIVSVYNECKNLIPEKSRIPLSKKQDRFCLFVTPTLYGVSGYMFWNVGDDLFGIYIAYFSILGVACMIRSLVPNIEHYKGEYAGRWACLSSLMLSYGTLCMSLHWAIQNQPSCIIAHCIAIFIISVYDLPLYILRPPIFEEALPLLNAAGISPVQN